MAERTALIAARILAEKVEPGRVVAVFQEPTCDWICSLLAILRIGAIYVPLDLRTTLPRLATIVNDCQPLAIVVHTATSKDVPALVSQGAKIIDISTLPCPVPESLPAFARADDPAVILYTSGSTGAPKGIILKHSSLVNEIEECTEKFGLGQEIVLQQSALSFDFSLFQIFAAIANGGTLYVVPRSGRGDPIALTKIIAAEKVTLTGAVPSEYASWLRHGVVAPRVESSWKIAVAGGEVVENDFVREFYSRSSPEMRLFQVYGPTEITISSHKIELASMQDQTRPEDFQIQIPVGYTSRNCSTYIVDEKLQPVPLGHQGEILIGGAGVAQGYLNNRQLTKQAFVPNAYAPPIFSSKGWKNVHRTGDRGRLRADGALLFEGRIAGDTQIKLRGIRIDFRDIESTIIREAKGVLSDAVVSLRTDPETLVAHVVFSPDHPWNNEGEVAKFLKQILSNLPLPQYMIPAMMIPLDTLPLNAHSKTDRLAIRALPLPLRAKPTESARLTEAESILRGIWIVFLSKDITNHHSIDPQADFFHVGGNSALLVRLQVRIRQTFSIALPLMDLFESSTLGGMASRIENSVAAVAIDWEHETELSESLLRVKTDIPNFGATSKDTSSSKVVLITGSTGYLGKHLLGKFIDNPTVSKIHCIAIRHPDLKHPVDSSKIINHQGDLTQPLLGLSNVAFQALVAEVDLVIHAGAQRSFWDSYHLLRVANLSSTQELVKLSAPRRIPIHFISSGGVLHLTVGDDAFSINNGENSVAAFPPPTDGSKGYVASKWASEVYLEKAARALDIPVSIHRSVPAAAGSSSTTPAHILADFVRFSKQMKALPSSHGWTGDFDLMPVNELAARVCTVALSAPASSSSSSPKTSTSRDEGQVTFVHHGAEVKLVAKEVAEQLEKAVDGGGVEGVQGAERIPAVEWVGRAKKMGFGWFFAAQNMVLDEEGEDGDGDGRGGRLVSRR